MSLKIYANKTAYTAFRNAACFCLSQYCKPPNTRYVYGCVYAVLVGGSCLFKLFLTLVLLRDVTQFCGFAIETLPAQGQVCTVLRGSGTTAKLQLSLAL